jgi:UDP-2,4-diacetamido-2,4,6-trideoxy-beta-L-altropyranose hydrolase
MRVGHVAFRVDLSQEIGSGHFMRCLTLADALSLRGAKVRFVCRDLPTVFKATLLSKGHEYVQLGNKRLPITQVVEEKTSSGLAHDHWLSVSQAQDANETVQALSDYVWDWLVVDHYALDSRWESAVRASCLSLMVIDDLADRFHVCDLLLDQTFGRKELDYRSLVPANCRLLCGSNNAILRSEFANARPYSLHRRIRPVLRELLITMGGVDKDNVTGKVLHALRSCPLPVDIRITVVMGTTAPWLDEVHKQAQKMPYPTRVLVGVSDMAQLIANSDFAIGAGGGTSWERCCLGVPTLMLVLADNQVKVAEGLERIGAVVLVNQGAQMEDQFASLFASLVSDPGKMRSMSESAARIAEGLGINSVLALMEVQHD